MVSSRLFALASFAQNYVQTKLVSDIAQPASANGTLVTIDPYLKALGVRPRCVNRMYDKERGTPSFGRSLIEGQEDGHAGSELLESLTHRHRIVDPGKMTGAGYRARHDVRRVVFRSFPSLLTYDPIIVTP
jgi:hypothetical protein